MSELKSEMAALETRATAAEEALEAKTAEVTKFVEGVEGELNDARKKVESLIAEL